jgi:cell wall-associated NlpC family hydrolase
MPDTELRSGNDRRDADGRPATRPAISFGQTAVTGWALAAVLGLASVGTALGATPAPTSGVLVLDTANAADTTGTAAGAGAAATNTAAPVADPFGILEGGPLLGSPAAPPTFDTVTAPSVPTQLAPAPGVAGGSATSTAAPGTIAPAGPAAQLRQAAFTNAAPDDRARVAVQTALAQIGLPYVWGGNGPTNGDPGFDCSGLTTFAYAAAGVRLPRTAHTQYNAGPHVPAGAPLQPGDLVFYGTTAFVHHVGMYLGDGRMVNAPTFGRPVQVAFYRHRGDDFLGATRPAAAAGSLTTGVLPYIDVPVLPVPVQPAPGLPALQLPMQVFDAPAATLPRVLPQPGDPALPPESQSAAQAIAESDAAAGATGRSVAGTTTSSSAPISTSPVANSSTGSSPVAGTTTSSSITTAAPGRPTSVAGTTTTGSTTTGATTTSTTPTRTSTTGTTTTGTTTTRTSTTARPATSTEKATGSTVATTTVVPTSVKPAPTTTRTTTVKATTTKATSTKTVTSPTSTSKVVTATKDDDPTSTASKTSSTKTSSTKTSSDESTSEKSSSEKSSSDESSSDESSSDKSSSDDDSSDS